MLLFQLISYPLFLTLWNTRASWEQILRSPRQLSLPFLSWSLWMTAQALLRNSSMLVDSDICLRPPQSFYRSILPFLLQDIINICLFVLIHMGRILGQTFFILVSTIVNKLLFILRNIVQTASIQAAVAKNTLPACSRGSRISLCSFLLTPSSSSIPSKEKKLQF